MKSKGITMKLQALLSCDQFSGINDTPANPMASFWEMASVTYLLTTLVLVFSVKSAGLKVLIDASTFETLQRTGKIQA